MAVAAQAKKLDVNEDMKPLLKFLLNNGFTKEEVPKVIDATCIQETKLASEHNHEKLHLNRITCRSIQLRKNNCHDFCPVHHLKHDWQSGSDLSPLLGLFC